MRNHNGEFCSTHLCAKDCLQELQHGELRRLADVLLESVWETDMTSLLQLIALLYENHHAELAGSVQAFTAYAMKLSTGDD